MRINHFITILIATVFAQHLNAQERGLPVIQNYSPKQYNSTPQVVSLMQGESGMMYLGLAGVILEYDGVSWRTIKSGRSETPYDMQIGKDKRIYVAGGAEFGYLTTDSRGNTIYKTLSNLITDSTYYIGTIWNIKTTNKFVYFQAENAIIQFNTNTETIRIFKKETHGQYASGFIYNNAYYVQLKKEGLVVIEDNELKPATHSELFKNTSHVLTGIQHTPHDFILATKNSGLYTYKPDEEMLPEEIKINNTDFFKDNNITRVSKVDDQSFIIGSMKKGAILVSSSGDIKQEYNETTLLQNNYARSISLDSDKNIWIGLSRGVAKTETSADLSYWNENNGLKDIVEDIIRYNNTIYIATHQNVYFINSRNQLQQVSNIEPGINWNFLETQNPRTLLLGSQSGIYEIRNNNAELIARGSHVCVLQLSKKDPKRVFSILNESFVSLTHQNGKWQLEGVWEGINENIRGIAEDSNGEIWLGTFRSGVIRVTPNPKNITRPLKSKYYNLADGFKSLKNILPFSFNNKIIWGTETGLFVHDSELDTFVPFCELGEQFCNGTRDVFHFKQMPDGTIWVSPLENNKADIGYLKPKKDGGYDWNFAPFRRIPNMLLVCFYPEESGVVWIGGSEGLYRYDMSKDTKDYKRNFNCYIRKVSTGNDSVLFAGSKVGNVNPTHLASSSNIKYSHNSLSFEFAAPFFDQEERTLYSFKLEGFDTHWSHWSHQTEKEYTNLREGDYTFNVRARNIYDVESSTDSYSLTINPPIYRTIWAYILYSLAIVASGWLFLKLKTHRLKSENIKLERIVQERTSDLSEVNTQLEEQQAELEIRQEEITAQAQILAETNIELEKLSIVARETDNAVIIMDEYFNFEWINEGFTKLYGLTLTDLKSNHGENLLNGSNYENIKHATEHCRETKEAVQYENKVKRGNTTRWVQTTLTPILDHHGQVRKYIAIDSDITQIKSAEQALKEQRDEIQSQNVKLKEMDEFKQGMTSMIVHDLKNPLNLILNMPHAFDAQKREKTTQQSARQMLNMVLNILDVNKYEEVGMKLELKEKSLRTVGVEAIEKVEFLCEQKAIALVNGIDPTLTAWIDADTVERVLVNLLTNAIKHSPIGETITLKVHLVSTGVVRVEVTNKGEGIADDKKHLVFQKFGQIVAKKSGAIKSTGLGLAFCKMAVEAHSGDIGVESDTEGQTTFWFTLKAGGNIRAKEKAPYVYAEDLPIHTQLTESEIKTLEPVIKRLKAFTIYETDDIEEILAELKSSVSPNIKSWVSQMERSLSALNQIKYLDLLSVINKP